MEASGAERPEGRLPGAPGAPPGPAAAAAAKPGGQVKFVGILQ